MPDTLSPPPDTFASDVRDARVIAVLGPTNTGKTHYAIERMCGYASGMIGLPLRLLAREIYERVVALKGVNAVALITGEEKIIPRLPSYFICTVEAMPLERQVDFLAVDEIQLCGDAERGYVFTDRLLHARGRFETLFLGATTFAPLFRRLFPEAGVMVRERLSQLSYSGPKKLTRLPKRSAIVAFSTEKVYAIAELIRRQRGGAAVVMGSLSPKTRNAQVALFQSGEVDFLVATDAIGMGLNMDIDHVAFSGLSKFDGKSTRHLTAQEIGQIAGRAGRFTKEGTFGVTGECHELDDDLVHAVENHQFVALDAAQWRNHRLEFSSLDALLKSLTHPSPQPGLHLSKEALDEKALRHLAQQEDIAAKISNPVSLRVLWEACQLPDFRKISLDEHLNLVSFLFWSRLSPDGHVAEDWLEDQVKTLDQSEGDIDTLSSRLSGVRTLSYIAHRGGWLKRVEHWREVTRDLEERLSDALHAALMQRFIDQRTSALLKALNAEEAPRPEVTAEGQVIIEGHAVGELKGLIFTLSSSESLIEDKTLRQAAHRAVKPVLLDRLRDVGNSPSKAFRVRHHHLLWHKEVVAEIEPGDWFAPRIRLLSDADHPALKARAEKRISDYLRQTSLSQLKSLWKIKQASENAETTAAVRAIAFQLYENGGVLRRDETMKLRPDDKAALKALGIAAHRYLWFLPELQKPQVRDHMRAFGGGEGARALSLRGQVQVGDYGPVPLRTLSQLDKIMGSGLYQKGVVYVREAALTPLGLAEKPRDKLLLALGLIKVPPLTVPVAVAPPVDATNDAAVIEAAADGAAPLVTEHATSQDATVPEAVPSETTVPEPAMETLLGWRQKSFEPKARHPRRDRRPAKTTAPEGAPSDAAKPGKPHRQKPFKTQKPGATGKPHNPKGGEKAREPKPREPYINPYSPFAILRQKGGF